MELRRVYIGTKGAGVGVWGRIRFRPILRYIMILRKVGKKRREERKRRGRGRGKNLWSSLCRSNSIYVFFGVPCIVFFFFIVRDKLFIRPSIA